MIKLALNDTAIILFYFWKLCTNNTVIHTNFIISFSKFLKSILISSTQRVKLTNNHLCGHYEQISSKSYKEVIQPQVPLGLPCYDFTPVMNHSVVIVLPKVRLTTSGATHSHGVTGGVYKARERIHRDILIRDY